MKLLLGFAIVLAGFVVVFPWEDVRQSQQPAVSDQQSAQQQSVNIVPQEQETQPTNTAEQEQVDSVSQSPQETTNVPATTDPSAQNGRLPDEVNLAVPFTPQAPHANWSLPYQEACEEAAALMAHWFFEGKSSGRAGSGYAGQKAKSKSRDEADAGIRNLVAFQNERYGFYKDTDGEETARFIRDRWGHAADVVYNPTVTMIKRELADGYPVIVLAAGRQLKNPYYTPPGPLYHALVIKGYTADGMFITNDPGTRRGADYRYRPDVLMNALHEWNGGKVETGRKVAIVVRP